MSAELARRASRRQQKSGGHANRREARFCATASDPFAASFAQAARHRAERAEAEGWHGIGVTDAQKLAGDAWIALAHLGRAPASVVHLERYVEAVRGDLAGEDVSFDALGFSEATAPDVAPCGASPADSLRCGVMGIRRFDRKFGLDLLRELPEAPAVYLFKDEQGDVIYVGKAKNVRRRLAQYRNASRRKAHRKMRELVRVAASLEVIVESSEADALLRENELIRELRPEYNVDGAYEFLYPSIGTGAADGQLWLCIASQTEPHAHLELQWHGCFRPRWRAREAFDALVSLCGRIGHLEPKTRLPELPAAKGTRFVAVRRMGPEWVEPIRALLDGESAGLLELLFDALLEERGARMDATEVQAELVTLKSFYEDEARRLRSARRRVEWEGTFVPQEDRDSLFIRAKAAKSAKVARASGSQSSP